MTVTLAERERQLSIARDEENMWLVTGPLWRVQARGIRRRAGRRRGLQPVLQRAADPADRAVSRHRIRFAAGRLRDAARPVGQPRRDQLQQRVRRHQAAFAGRRHHRHASTRTASSSTTPDWQSGFDHPAGPAGGGQFVAPVVCADDDRDDLRPAEAVIAHAGGVTFLDEFGHRPAESPATCGPSSACRWSGRVRAAAVRSSLRTSPAPDPARWRPPGCRRGTIRRPARRPTAPRPRWRPAPRRAGAADARWPPLRRRARRIWPAPRRRRSPAPASMTIDHTAGSTWSSTLTTHGAPTNRRALPGRPARARGARHRVTADEAVQQTGGLDLVEDGAFDAGDVGQRAVRGEVADVAEHDRQRGHRHGEHDQRAGLGGAGQRLRRCSRWRRNRRPSRPAPPRPTGCSRKPLGRPPSPHASPSRRSDQDPARRRAFSSRLQGWHTSLSAGRPPGCRLLVKVPGRGLA